MTLTARPLFTTCLLLSLTAAQANSATSPYTVEYQAKALGQSVGTASRVLEHHEGNWRLTLDSDARLLFLSNKHHEQTEVRRDDQGWQSLRYEYRDEGTGKTKFGEQAFDWHGKQVSGNREGKPYSLPLSGPTFDMASYQLQLGFDLAADKPDLDYTLVHRGKIKHYHFERRGEETLETPMGPLKTIKVEKPAADKGDESTLIWFAPSLDYVPVKIQHLSGNTIQLELTLARFQQP